MDMVEFVVKTESQAGSGKEYRLVHLKCCSKAASGGSCFNMPWNMNKTEVYAWLLRLQAVLLKPVLEVICLHKHPAGLRLDLTDIFLWNRPAFLPCASLPESFNAAWTESAIFLPCCRDKLSGVGPRWFLLQAVFCIVNWWVSDLQRCQDRCEVLGTCSNILCPVVLCW